MNMWLVLGSLLFSGTHPLLGGATAADETAADRQLMSVMACRGESSPLVRLECYDNALTPAVGETGKITQPLSAGPAWQKAIGQEKKRLDHSTAFLVSEGTGDNSSVFITTPALGIAPPRPILMFSCVDNITRMQIALNEPQTDGAVKISADNDRFDARWFLRENGYLLESSRGLAGIDEIKRLMEAKTLIIEGAGSGFPRLTFNISQLTQVLKPLRSACHW